MTDIPYRLGCIRDPEDSRDYQVKGILSKIKISSGDKLKLRYNMSPVKDQGHKGSCVGFAVAAVLEWQQQQEYLNERKKGSSYKRNKEHYDLSEQWIYHKAKEIDDWPDQEGTSIRHALKIVNKDGVPTEKGWPYSDMIIGKPEFWAYSTAKWNRNKNYYRINNIDELRNSLLNIGPCIIGIPVFDEFLYPRRGWYVGHPENPSRNYGGHAICVVGFNEERNSNKKFIIKNSWGEKWGTGGYASITYSYLEDFMLDAWVTIDNTKITGLNS